MFDQEERQALRDDVQQAAQADRTILDELIDDIRHYGLRGQARRIQHYTIPSIAITSTDGGNHKFVFNPFRHQVIRVVDSSGQTLGLKVITLTTNLRRLSASEFTNGPGGGPTPVGRLMSDIGNAVGEPITELHQLCPSIPESVPQQTEDRDNAAWVMSYRDLWEWAVLYTRIMDATFPQSTLIIRDGVLRTKLFASNYFRVMGDLLAERIEQIRRRERKDIYLVGLAKSSSVIERYSLALAIEDVFPSGSPYYVQIPRALEERAYKFPEFARGRERLPKPSMTRDAQGQITFQMPAGSGPSEDSKFVFGTMFLTRLSDSLARQLWAVDIFDDQVSHTERIMACLLADARDGFPIPCYPNAIQRAHDAAKLTDLDAEMINRAIMDSIRELVGAEHQTVIDRINLTGDLTGRRY